MIASTSRTPVLAAAVGLALLVGACSSSSSDDGTSAPTVERSTVTSAGADDTTERASGTGAAVDACTLLTEADATRAFGEPVQPVTQTTDECWWESANTLKTVNIIRRDDDLETWRAGYQNDYWTPNGLGDEGYTGRALDSAVFRVGEDLYEVNIVWSTRGEPSLDALELATLAAGRL